jgi:hypothetical protein
MAMIKIADRVRESLKPHLEPGEELRSVGWFMESVSILKKILIGWLARKVWYVGITEKRVIFARAKKLKPKIVQNAIFTVPLGNVVVSGNKLLITSPDANLPKSLKFSWGSQRTQQMSGLNEDEFKKALTN